MAMTTQTPSAYTAGSAVIGVLRRFRDKGLATPFTLDVLVRAGVPESLGRRTLQSLQVLDLIDDKGTPTPTLNKIRLAPEKEYQSVVAEWIKSAYAEVFQFVDPSTDDAAAIRDAFRSYTPVGQQDRMVALFLALCAEAGLIAESKKSEPKPSLRKPLSRTPVPAATPRAYRRDTGSVGYLPPALDGLMRSLPSTGTGWTKDQRDRFVETFKSVLDFVVPVVTKETVKDAEENES
jgi:hypothetical protein